MNMDDLPDKVASPDEVREAIESLSMEDLYRIIRAGRILISNTDYHHADELINEALKRTMAGSHGQQGRHWRINVPFIAFVVETMKSLVKDAIDSAYQRNFKSLDGMATEEMTVDDVRSKYEQQPDLLTDLIEDEEIKARGKSDATAVSMLEIHFKDDVQVTWIIMGIKESYSAAQICEVGEMTKTEYETARKRLRRAVDKLFPNGRTI